MSEQKRQVEGFMAELNKWTHETIADPLIYGDWPEDPKACSRDDIIDEVKAAIQQKVLESYRNGQAARGGKRS